METVQIIGIAASTGTGISLLPQLIKIIKQKKSENISLGMMAVLVSAYILWIIYGTKKENMIIVISNAVSLLLTIATIIFSLKYRKKNK